MKRVGRTAFACALAITQASTGCTRSSGVRELVAIRTEAFATTSGHVTVVPGGWRVESPGMRGIARTTEGSRRVELAFRYLGPSRMSVPLGSGELRRQIGLKLRAQDTCNVVYVMWHLEPKQDIAVSIKSNPGLATHQACGDRGYVNLAKACGEPVPPLRPEEQHRLRAEMDGDALSVFADGRQVWHGRVPSEAFAFDGPVGVRTDNGRFDFSISVDES